MSARIKLSFVDFVVFSSGASVFVQFWRDRLWCETGAPCGAEVVEMRIGNTPLAMFSKS
jgi:hypothetical protein